VRGAPGPRQHHVPLHPGVGGRRSGGEHARWSVESFCRVDVSEGTAILTREAVGSAHGALRTTSGAAAAVRAPGGVVPGPLSGAAPGIGCRVGNVLGPASAHRASVAGDRGDARPARRVGVREPWADGAKSVRVGVGLTSWSAWERRNRSGGQRVGRLSSDARSGRARGSACQAAAAAAAASAAGAAACRCQQQACAGAAPAAPAAGEQDWQCAHRGLGRPPDAIARHRRAGRDARDRRPLRGCVRTRQI